MHGGQSTLPTVKLEDRWDRLDWVWVGVLTTVSAVMRAIGLGSPRGLVFDEFYYVPDACRYVIQIADVCGPQEYTWMHPPLGKWAIGLGLEILGPTRYGWRLMPLVAGVLTIALVYVLGRALFQSRVAAVVAAGFLTLDFLHYVHSRIATLDIFVTLWVVTGTLFLVLDREQPEAGVLRPWRLGAGVAFGAAVATKWSAGLLLIGAIVLTLLWDRARSREGSGRGSALAASALGLLLIPLVVYLVSYAGRFEGPLLAAPWSEGSWFSMWLDRQQEIVRYHTVQRAESLTRLQAHPSASPAWSWLLLKRPMTYYFDAHGGLYREILAMGHVLLWPLGVPVLAWLGARAARARELVSPTATVLALFAFAYLPWFFLTGQGQDPYLYYLLPGIPFLCLAFGAAAARLWPRVGGRLAVAAVALAAAGVWVFYLPLLRGTPLPVPQWRDRIVFTDCALFEGPSLDRLLSYADRELALEGLDGPPRPSDRLFPTGTRATGWCWI